jgi:hypothetical protein
VGASVHAVPTASAPSAMKERFSMVGVSEGGP